MNYEIRKIDPSENQLLSELCFKIYPQTFQYLWHDDGTWYMETMYNPTKLLEELNDIHSSFYFLVVNDISVGYLKTNNHFQEEENSFEIERIYLDENFAGKGLGGILLNFGINQAKLQNKKEVYLKVMNCSSNTIRFYQKHGFEQVGWYNLNFEQMKDSFRQINTMKLTLKY
ncbi:MAG: GNAT family N-acetyltransferase [Arcicella sp.]|jgi:GNAT superfamily N-acetyltransferase|nr:GNAT family N-acetyltransferase [Arcicella sp.]